MPKLIPPAAALALTLAATTAARAEDPATATLDHIIAGASCTEIVGLFEETPGATTAQRENRLAMVAFLFGYSHRAVGGTQSTASDAFMAAFQAIALTCTLNAETRGLVNMLTLLDRH